MTAWSTPLGPVILLALPSPASTLTVSSLRTTSPMSSRSSTRSLSSTSTPTGSSVVPGNLLRLVHFRELDLSNNRFCGPFPEEILRLPELNVQELRNTGSRAEDAASEKDGTGREPTGSVRPKDERAAEEYSGELLRLWPSSLARVNPPLHSCVAKWLGEGGEALPRYSRFPLFMAKGKGRSKRHSGQKGPREVASEDETSEDKLFDEMLMLDQSDFATKEIPPLGKEMEAIMLMLLFLELTVLAVRSLELTVLAVRSSLCMAWLGNYTVFDFVVFLDPCMAWLGSLSVFTNCWKCGANVQGVHGGFACIHGGPCLVPWCLFDCTPCALPHHHAALVYAKCQHVVYALPHVLLHWSMPSVNLHALVFATMAMLLWHHGQVHLPILLALRTSPSVYSFGSLDKSICSLAHYHTFVVVWHAQHTCLARPITKYDALLQVSTHPAHCYIRYFGVPCAKVTPGSLPSLSSARLRLGQSHVAALLLGIPCAHARPVGLTSLCLLHNLDLGNPTLGL
ncbi:hypothetical protein ZIOFF_040714 [Zingiber officinale]|uniref:Uncharacterized protein n=1 Tax=Zingiber officinale TaxID=94328 RepID=A0A8J5G6L3_ZINOF|nr:hypothetical protein ZIOFF_040714 [Zingiber officinale]